jgi:hypothetical protein
MRETNSSLVHMFPENTEAIPGMLAVSIEGCAMSEERERLDKAFHRSRSRLAYLNVGLAAVLVLTGVIEICIMLLSDG